MDLIGNIIRNYVITKTPRYSRIGSVVLSNNVLEDGEGYSATVLIQPDVDKDAAYTVRVEVKPTDSEITVADRIVDTFNKWLGEQP